MSMKYIREYYNVPAKRGARIECNDPIYDFIYGFLARDRKGTIVGSRGAYIRVRMDGDNHIKTLHPTWNVRYL